MTTLQKTPSQSSGPGPDHGQGHSQSQGKSHGHDSGQPHRRSSAGLRFHVLKAVYWRNVASYFINPAGYVYLTLFVLVCALVAFCLPAFFANNLANLDTLNDWIPYLLLFFIPAITMNIWAEERRQGTEELLLTLPAKDLEVVLGKYFAALGIYTVALLFSFTLVFILMQLGQPDLGVTLATYAGYWLMGAMLIAVGMVASLLSSNVTVAFILGGVFCAIPIFFGLLSFAFETLWARQIVEDLSMIEQFKPFGTGVIPIAGVVYFLSLTVVMLYLNMILLGRRHWAGGQRSPQLWAHALTRTIALAVILGGVTILITGVTWQRIDASSEKLHTLSPEARTIVSKIPAGREVFIQAFYSPEMPREHVATRNNLLNLLRQFKAWGGGKIQLNLVPTEPYSEEALKAAKFGIQARPVVSSDESRRTASEIFLGVAFTSGLEEVVIPFVEPGLSIEYELSRSIKVVTGAVRKKVGILSTDAQLMGGGGGMMGGGGREWEIVRELKLQYEVKTVSPDTPINPSEVDVLIVAQPSSLTQPQIDNLTNFVMAGGPTLMLLDPLPFLDPNLSPEMPKPAPARNPMFGGGQPPPTPKGNLQPLLAKLGVDWPSNEIVWNPNNPHPQIASALPDEVEFMFLTNTPKVDVFNPKEAITSGLQELVGIYGGRLIRRSAPGLTFTPLIKTDANGGLLTWRESVTSQLDFGGMDVVEAASMAMNMGLPGGLRLRAKRPHVVKGNSYVLAARIHAEDNDPADKSKAKNKKSSAKDKSKDKAKDAAAQGPMPHVILVADLDFVSDGFFDLRRASLDQLRRSGLGNMVLDNVAFILNSVDTLAGDDTFVEMRKRRPEFRTLTWLERQTKQFEEKAQEELQVAQTQEKNQIDKAQEEFTKDVEAVQKDETLDPTVKDAKIKYLQEVANRRLTQKRQEIENDTARRIEESVAEKERNIRKIQNQTRLKAMLLPTMLPAVVGVIVFFVRLQRENRGANPRRLA